MDIKDVKNQFPIWRGWYGKFLPKDKSARILDVGCGHGGVIFWLQNTGFANAEGVDINWGKIEMGLDMGVKNLHHGDALSFVRNKKDQYDKVFIIDVADFLSKEEIVNVLEAVFASLRKGGMVIMRSSNTESPVGRLRYVHFGERVDFTEQSLKSTLAAAGFENVGAYPVRPVVHGVKSFVRHCLWRLIEFGLKFYRLVEVGNPSGIFTQNMIVVGKKP